MANNEPAVGTSGGDGPARRLLAALDEGGAAQLATLIERAEAEQLLYWYELLAEVSIDELLAEVKTGSLTTDELHSLFRAIHLLMQWEHAQSEELKELFERDAADMAAREENWAAEREALRAELSTQRERITARAGVDNVHEAFRAEIDALAAENAELKQQQRHRDRELAEQRDRADELDGRVQSAERERALLVANQSQLEDTIRELNRRLSTRSEASQRGQEWESRKLRQRNEQALVLSEQVRELAAQNDELRAEVVRLTRALEEATELVKENTLRFGQFDEQLAEAEQMVGRLNGDNQELRTLLAEREKELKQRADKADLGSREFVDVLQAKDAQLEQMRAQMGRQRLELDQLQLQLEAAQPDHEQKEAELEQLRLELVAATERARRLFGETLAEEETKLGFGRAETGGEATDLRLRLVQMDRELDKAERDLRAEKRQIVELEAALEGKELQIARLLSDCQRYRKMAFGDAEAEIRHIEGQLQYRDRQIQQLNRRCSELQLQVEKLLEGREEDVEKPAEKKKPEQADKMELKPILEEFEGKEVEAVQVEEETPHLQPTEEEYAIVQMEDEAAFEAHVPELAKLEASVQTALIRPTRQELLSAATRMNVLHGEVARVVHELEEREKQLEQLKKLHAERGRQLQAAKEAEAKAQREMVEFKELLLFGEADQFLDEVEGSGIQTKERLEALQLENMELRRLADNLATSGDERERRMAEGARRLVYLAVKEAKLDRRVQIGQRLRKAMVDELYRMRTRLARESRSRQMALENETILFELARLQNALLHSVPLPEYSRVLRENKRLLRDRFLQSADAGYHSAGEGSEEEEIEVLSGQLDITRAGLLSDGTSNTKTLSDALLAKCRRLQDVNDVLEAQNRALRQEGRKTEAELAELNAFLDDLEAETELKSMLANIERRFLHALREQFDAASERETLHSELQRVERNFREAREQWLTERQSLVHQLGLLHSAAQRLHRERVQPVPVSMTQLEILARKLREMREKEVQLVRREEAVVQREEAAERVEHAEAARKEALETMLANDWQLEQVYASLQGYQLNLMTLSTELKQCRQKLELAERKLQERQAELDELRQNAADFQFTLGFDLKTLEETVAKMTVKTVAIDDVSKPKEEEASRAERRDSLVRKEQPVEQPLPVEIVRTSTTTKLVVLNNTAQWEQHLREVREQAKLCVDSYKEQLAQKETSLEHYRALLEQLKADFASKEAAPTAKTPPAAEVQKARPKSAEELLAESARAEQWERKVRSLESRVRILEEENMELEIERMRLADALKKRATSKERRNVQIQVNLPAVEEKPLPKPNEPEALSKEESVRTSPDAARQEDGSEAEADENGPPSGSSDSGTVDDIGGRNGRARRPSPVIGVSRSRSSAGTRTLPPRAAAGGKAAAADERETLILRHRNETRRLRMRLIELERRNKELSEQYASLRERARLMGRPRSSAIPDSATAEGALRKENERLQRQNAALSKSAEAQRQTMEEMEKRLRRAEAQSKAGAELWEERKRHERTKADAQKRLAEAEARERELRERLERRERHIEQLGKEKAGRLADGDRLNAALRQWRDEKKELEKAVKILTDEKSALASRCEELLRRLEELAKRHKTAQKTLDSAHQKEQNLMEQLTAIQASRRKTPMVEAQTQTIEKPIERGIGTSHNMHSARSMMPASPSLPASTTGRQSLTESSKSQTVIEASVKEEWKQKEAHLLEENQSMAKRLRRAELLHEEASEQLDTLRRQHAQLLEDYNGLLRLGELEQQRRSSRDEQETLGLALLRDKLAAREREIQLQRRRIIELERQFWQAEMSRASS